ncbi:MAG: recombinase family protein [Planctomycetes bacterium]|nr:recombinase family protein [Planctomycetota bacterium]
MTRVFGYCRTADYMETASLEEQRRLIERGAAELDGEWQGCRAEHDSRPWTERPGFQALLDELQAGDHVIVCKLKQIDPHIAHVADAVDRLVQQEVHFHVLHASAGMGLHLSPKTAPFFVAVWRWLLEERTRCHGEAIRRALQNQRQTGRPGSSAPPFGKKRITRAGHKFDVWNLKECDRIREIAHRHAQGETIASIARDFHRRRLRTSAGRLWVRKYGVKGKRRLNGNRLYRALRFYEKLRDEGRRLGA